MSKLNPQEIEKLILEKDAKTAKETNPLDSHASFFHLYIFRFKQQVKMMSKKQLIKLVESLVGSEYNKNSEVNQLLNKLNNLNLNSVIRVINNVVEFPLNEKEVKLMSLKEKNAFALMDSLIAEKYVASLEQIKDVSQVKTIQDVVKHSHKEKEFNKRSQVEKDAFATGNQLLGTKTLLIQYTVLEQLKLEEDAKKNEGEKNG